MRKVNVLLVDDAVVVRRLVSDVLSSEGYWEVSTAPNGRIALMKLPQLKPDVIILDIEMPEMDGLETLKRIRQDNASIPIIMFSTLTSRGATATLEALTAGANDYVTKPTSLFNRQAAVDQIEESLVPRLKAFCGHLLGQRQPAPTLKRARSARPEPTARIDAVVIGISTGGPNALVKVIPQLPANFPVPILIVQHMPPMFTKVLADRLAAASRLQVREAGHGMPVRPATVYLAPGGHHMTVTGSVEHPRIALNQLPPENSCRPAADVLFRSVADVYGRHLLAVVMTGMGQDGMLGCEVIRKKGGQILAQDEASSVVWGMPGHVVRAGLADEVVPLNQMAHAIQKHVDIDRRKGLRAAG